MYCTVKKYLVTKERKEQMTSFYGISHSQWINNYIFSQSEKFAVCQPPMKALIKCRSSWYAIYQKLWDFRK